MPTAPTAFLVALVAQALPPSPEALSGGSGWAGAGLLSLVLGWLLFKHLPAKDAQIERLLAAADARSEGQQQTFRDAIKQVVEHCEAEMTALGGRQTAHEEAARESRHKDRQVQQAMANQLQILADRLAARPRPGEQP